MSPSHPVEPLFKRLHSLDVLSAEEEQAILDAAEGSTRFSASDDIVKEGDRPTRSALLSRGFAARYRLVEGGKRQITAIHVAGDFVDLHGFLLKEMDHSVAALGPCEIVAVPHRNLKRITERFPHLTRLLWLLTLIDGSIHREWLVGMGRLPAPAQAAHLICEIDLRLALVGLSRDHAFRFPATQTDLADTLGLSVVHVNRILQELRAEGLLRWQQQAVDILDFPRLAELAEFDARYLHLNSDPR